MKADLESHHIEGIAVQGDTPFSVDLVSHIYGNLWTGGCIDGVRLTDDFEYVVSLYPWEKYAIGPDTTRVELRLRDEAALPDIKQLYDVAHIVNAFREKGKTLVHCQAGLNRSGLVAGLAMILDGWDAVGAIAQLRKQRCSAVLCNRTFEEYLLTYNDRART